MKDIAIEMISEFLQEVNLWSEEVADMVKNEKAIELLNWAETIEDRVATPVRIFANGIIVRKNLEQLSERIAHLQNNIQSIKDNIVPEDVNWH